MVSFRYMQTREALLCLDLVGLSVWPTLSSEIMPPRSESKWDVFVRSMILEDDLNLIVG